MAAPGLNDVSCLIEVGEAVLSEAFVPELSIDALDPGVLDRLAGADAMKFDAVLMRPGIKRPSRELRAIVDGNGVGQLPVPMKTGVARDRSGTTDARSGYSMTLQRCDDFFAEAMPHLRQRHAPRAVPIPCNGRSGSRSWVHVVHFASDLLPGIPFLVIAVFSLNKARSMDPVVKLIQLFARMIQSCCYLMVRKSLSTSRCNESASCSAGSRGSRAHAISADT